MKWSASFSASARLSGYAYAGAMPNASSSVAGQRPATTSGCRCQPRNIVTTCW
jgi:hypothetical protein